MNGLRIRKLRALLACGCLACCCLQNDAAYAGHPAYWTIGRQHQAAAVQPVHPQGFAYGWFGASPRPQGQRQTGYYGLYRQWTIK